MNKKQKKILIRIIISALLTLILYFLPINGLGLFLLYLIPYFIIGYDILIKAFKGFFRKQVFDENFLMAVATIGALVIGLTNTGDYLESVAVMLFYQIGELFQSYAVNKSRKNIGELMDIRPDYANVETDGSLRKISPEDVKVGTVIKVLPGEKIPLDGIVTEGFSSINTSALTGESIPKDVKPDDEVLSGCINMSGVISIRTTKEFGESTASKLMDLIENASFRKSESENFITKFAKVYTPIVCLCAVILAVFPPVISLLLGASPNWSVWIYRALSFLVTSCPCALVVSIPLCFFAGIGKASRQGILVKGSNYLEALSKTECVVFDKTGTLTQGNFEVSAVHHNRMSQEKLVEIAAIAECCSSHPIAKSLQKAYGKKIDRTRVGEVNEINGNGVIAVVDGVNVAVGNDKLMKLLGVNYKSCHKIGTIIHVAVNNEYQGHIVISDIVKPTSAKAVSLLKKSGVNEIVMLTGDSNSIAKQVADSLEIKKAYGELLPNDKVKIVEQLIGNKSKKSKLVFVGDGINDAPVLSCADIGIAMGGVGSDAAVEASDIVLMDDNPLSVVKAIKISKKCLKVVYQNISLTIGVKLLALISIAFGFVGMWMAVFADVGVMFLAVLNVIRTMFNNKTSFVD